MVPLLQREGQTLHRCAATHHPTRSTVSAHTHRPTSTSQIEREGNGTFDQSPPTHRYGIRAFDTSPYYDNSEIVLGTALKALENEFPRDTYRLLTKVGRYGPSPGTDPSATDFDYSPSTIRRSVHRSLQRLHTHYLDVVYLHDIEFVAPCVAPRAEGNHLSALGAEAAAYGLPPPERNFFPSGKGEAGTGSIGILSRVGDDDSDGRILEAVSELRALQAEGLIRQVGISGPSSFLLPHSLTIPTNKPTKVYLYRPSSAPRSSS